MEAMADDVGNQPMRNMGAHRPSELRARPSLKRAPRIRRATTKDLDAVEEIERASFEADRFSRRALARLLKSRSARGLIAEADGRPLGYTILLFRKGARAARLYSIATAPVARGRGVAANLLRAAEACAIDLGRERLRLEVRSSNRVALRLYRKAGFAILKPLPNYYADGESALRMEKRLGVAEGKR